MRISDVLRQEVRALMDDVAKRGLRDAIRRSSGPFSLSALRQMDHPYATRHGSPLLDPSRINVQKGVFRSSWEASSGHDWAQIRNDDPKTRFFFGTDKMFTRPIGGAVEMELRPFAAAAELDAVNRISARF